MQRKGVEILEATACVDHIIHIMVGLDVNIA